MGSTPCPALSSSVRRIDPVFSIPPFFVQADLKKWYILNCREKGNESTFYNFTADRWALHRMYRGGIIAHRTVGFSAAGLSAVMNQSTIQAILHNTTHTIETVETGIETIGREMLQKGFS